ncbi:hypothetical protein CBS101457_000606 [Exobasidium rhododendri]|nr:hypothetical protein CBS101457_000606 [Exobasidium rhododendri]
MATSTPVSNTQQIVLADVEDATRLNPSHRQGDLVDSMIAEAKAKNQDLSAWGIDIHEGDEIVRQKNSNDLAEHAESYIETVDLDDEMAKVKLMWEAALEDSLVTIQPIAAKVAESKPVSKGRKNLFNSLMSKFNPPGSGWVWKNCGSGEEAAVLRELDVDPDPPVAGQNLTVSAKGIVTSPIREGTYADVVVKLGFIRLLSRRFDICQLAEENDAELRCPLEPGEYSLTQTVTLPKEIPPAKFNVHVSGKTQDDVDFVCTDLSIDFMHH